MEGYSSYLFLAMFGLAALLFALAPLGLARLWAWKFAPRKPGSVKNAAYECGLESAGVSGAGFHSRFYGYALVFLVFDVESIFLFPCAVAFLELPVGAVVAILVFVLLLAEGLVWAWLNGVLDWH
jgi:NADH-quinone oxidoreductase subunit A